MEVTQPLIDGLGLVVGINHNTVTQCVQQQNLSVHATINDSREFSDILSLGISCSKEKGTWEIS